MVHIGQEIEKVFDKTGMTQKAFASRIPTGAKKLRETVFSKESLDSEMLARIGEILHFDFFNLYSKPRTTSPINDTVPIVIRMTVELDGRDPKLKEKMAAIARIVE